MKILISLSDQVWGGKQAYTFGVATELQRRGHDIGIFCETGSKTAARFSPLFDVWTAPPFCDDPSLTGKRMKELLSGSTSNVFDVLVMTGRHDLSAARQALARWNHNLGLVMFRHSAFPLPQDHDTRKFISGLDLIVCTSLEQAHRQFDPAVAAGELASEKLHVMLSSVPPDWPQRVEECDELAVRRNLRVPEESFAYLYSGRLSWEKGVDRLIRAFAQLDEEEKERSILLVLGEGPEEAALRSLAAEQGVSDLVYFLGHRDDTAPVYAVADCLVLPTTVPETGPLVLKEAMAAGVPVIASRVGGIPEFIRDNDTGLLTTDTASLVRAMNTLARDEACARRIASRARTAVTTRQRLLPRVDHLERLLLQIASRTAGPERALSTYQWADVRFAHNEDSGLAFVPESSFVTQLPKSEFDDLVSAYGRRDADPRSFSSLSPDVLERLLQMRAVIPATRMLSERQPA